MTGRWRLAAALRPLPLGLGLTLLLLSGCALLQPPPPIPEGIAPRELNARQFSNEHTYLEAWGIIRSSYFDSKVLGQEWVEARNRHLAEAINAADTQLAVEAFLHFLVQLAEDCPS